MYVCEKPCQLRKGNQILTFQKGDLVDLKKDHPYFRNLERGELSFETAGEEELLAANFNLADLKEFIKERYGKNPRNRNRDNTIKMLLDCRYRDIDNSELERLE